MHSGRTGRHGGGHDEEPRERHRVGRASERAAILYGSFIQNVVNFILVALVVFLIVKGINNLRRKKEEPAPVAIFEEIG